MTRRAKTPATPRKKPSQERSRAMVETILDAAARILVRDGYRAFTTNRVAERAGVSVGSLYQYFPNKEAMLTELLHRHLGDLERGVEEMAVRSRSAPLAEIVRDSIASNVRAHLVAPDLHRVLSEEVPRTRQVDWQDAFVARVAKHVRTALEAKRAEITVGDLDLAVYLLCKTVDAVVHDAVQNRREALESGVVTEELARMIVSYLTGKPLSARRPARAAAE